MEEAIGVTAACRVLVKSRSTLHRQRNPELSAARERKEFRHPAELAMEEKKRVLAELDSPRFADKSVAQAYTILLDDGCYLCSQATMHRLLREQGTAGERRAHASHPARKKPELLAAGPNDVWSWDITKLKGPARGTWYLLYVIMDIYSRKVIHWEIWPTETDTLAKEFIQHAIAANDGIIPKSVHADRGTSMTSNTVAGLYAKLNITQSHSRPRVPNDNPYSESALPGSGQGSHLPAPTDPDVNLSVHPARAVQSFGQYRSAQCANSRGASSLTSPSHSRALLSLRSSRLYFLCPQRIRWRSMRSQSGITMLG
jgi:putative transposase